MQIANLPIAFDAINQILLIIGYWFLFKKCGIKEYWAFIPVAREYNMSLCADRESDGRMYAVTSLAFWVIEIIFRAAQNTSRAVYLLIIPASAFGIAMLIYKVRVYLGLLKIFDKKRRWIWLFVFFEIWVVFYFGISKKIVPNKKVLTVSSEEGAKESGTSLKAIDDGLTVNIKKRTVFDFFKKKVLLKDIHMTIPKGHMVLLLGGSGAGKTTFVNAVTGYEQADAEIKLNGSDIYEEYEKMLYDIGFVPQQDLMRGNDTVLLTLSDAATLRLPANIYMSERYERINKVLDQFGLSTVKNSLVEKLSGGQRKRLSIAMEFIADPTLFILDEPDSGLDGVVARNLFEKLREIANEGKIVIVITHTPDRVIDLFDDVIVLAKDAGRTGRLAWYGPVNEAYEFFGKKSMEEILLSVNQKDEGGEGRADEFVEKYAERLEKKVG